MRAYITYAKNTPADDWYPVSITIPAYGGSLSRAAVAAAGYNYWRVDKVEVVTMETIDGGVTEHRTGTQTRIGGRNVAR